ncbi:hypothetical protein EJD97_003602 [Solanum chilense]|uniref:ARID domain-containing protein n=1 Tax=Solanum chilense TaxID=4083 RepID=A0A6N2CD00_SOLCI|nr:hypothetical protein EJD97_003602 [Solanum chilense]
MLMNNYLLSFCLKDGWSKRVDGLGLESFSSVENVSKLDSVPVNRLLKEVNGCLCFRPFPPMLDDGKAVDLCKLFLVVREKGGYERVCASRSWGVVAVECGFDLTTGSSLKLVYVKYLDALNRAMVKLEQPDNEKKSALGFSAVRMDLELDLKGVLMEICDEKKKDEEHGKMEFDPAADGNLSDHIEVQDFVEKRSLDGSVCDVKGIYDNRLMKLSEDGDDCIIRKRKYSDGKIGVNFDEKHLKIDDGNGDVQGGSDDIGLTKFRGDKEDSITRQRKRESNLDMLKWVIELAKDPCDPAIGNLPEKSKWKSYGNEVVWKKVLLLRDEMLLEGNVDTSTRNSIWQQKQKMHPSMYDDNSGSEQLRCSQRVQSAKDYSKKSGSHIDATLINRPTDSSAESGVWWNRRRKKIASIGSEFQADIPEWNKDIYESDSKWLGTRIWPLDKNEQRRILIERDPAGKGRDDTCGCEYEGSYDCIRFHLSEKRKKLEVELGSAFYHWKFDCMGEKVALSWTSNDKQKFHDIAKSIPLSEDESFSYWPDLFKFFPHRSRESLVSYYFNVYNLHRIGQQNRMNTSYVDSDDDESGCGPRSISFGRDTKSSISCSTKKTRLDPIW